MKHPFSIWLTTSYNKLLDQGYYLFTILEKINRLSFLLVFLGGLLLVVEFQYLIFGYIHSQYARVSDYTFLNILWGDNTIQRINAPTLSWFDYVESTQSLHSTEWAEIILYFKSRKTHTWNQSHSNFGH